MSIQILQYEFLGPVSIGEWGPPMEKVVYAILGRDKDSFNMLYVGDCERTDKKSFLVDNPGFKCWVDKAGSEGSLYIAILPLFDAPDGRRAQIADKVIAHYRPACNDAAKPAPPPYRISAREPDEKTAPKTICQCCGSEMEVERVLEKSTVMRCKECGISDTRLNS